MRLWASNLGNRFVKGSTQALAAPAITTLIAICVLQFDGVSDKRRRRD